MTHLTFLCTKPAVGVLVGRLVLVSVNVYADVLMNVCMYEVMFIGKCETVILYSMLNTCEWVGADKSFNE